jgi:hypothetical protein
MDREFAWRNFLVAWMVDNPSRPELLVGLDEGSFP